MNMFRAFMELDSLNESFNDRAELIAKIKATGRRYNFDKYSAEQLYRIWQRIQTSDSVQVPEPKASRVYDTCPKCDSTLTDGGFCLQCDNGYDLETENYLEEASELTEGVYTSEMLYENWVEDRLLELFTKSMTAWVKEDWSDYFYCLRAKSGYSRALQEAAVETALSTDLSVISVVDQLKLIYENGLFNKLPTGRKNAFTVDIYGPDKERLVSYFKRQSDFNYEMHNEAGIISHEFISDKYDIEIFDTFVSMYKIPQTEALEAGLNHNWVTANGTKAAQSSMSNTTQPAGQASTQTAANIPTSGYVVTIIWDPVARKLRARANDGIHGDANVAFPNNLRIPGEKYHVEKLLWNGKNYRASGSITSI